MKWIILSTVLVSILVPALSAQELSIGFPAELPPWTIQKKDAGITVEIVRKSLKHKGYTLKTRFFSLKQLNQNIPHGMDANAQVESPALEGYYSDEVSQFQTSLISLKPNRLTIETINDLKDKHIVAFQNASFLFSNAFQKMTQSNSHYREIANQEYQVVDLYNGKAAVILVDRQIFLYFRGITTLTNTSMPVTFHEVEGLTEKSPFFVVFRDEKLRNEFNEGLEYLKKNGEYDNIFYKYVK
ncbi:MAG: transporter substrate-binding domain-containing protein [SAR324 cluster bacterium]|nr:transporter substrate-binding domain-containing protein [SAR324 cluster bacterium]